jgi:hypothetical protein
MNAAFMLLKQHEPSQQEVCQVGGVTEAGGGRLL